MLSPPVSSLVALAPRSVGVANAAARRDFTSFFMGSLSSKFQLTMQSSPVRGQGEPYQGLTGLTGADRALGAEYAVLAEARVVGLDDLADLRPVRRGIEHDHHQELGALAHDPAAGRFARLALDVQHAEAVGKARGDDLGHELRPLGFAHLAATLLVAAEIEVDLQRCLERRGADQGRSRLGAGSERDGGK